MQVERKRSYIPDLTISDGVSERLPSRLIEPPKRKPEQKQEKKEKKEKKVTLGRKERSPDYLTEEYKQLVTSCTSSTLDGTDLDVEGLVKPLKELDPEIGKKIIAEFLEQKIEDKRQVEQFIRSESKKYHALLNESITRAQILNAYRVHCLKNDIPVDKKYIELLQIKSFRSQSGVLVVTVFTSPFPTTTKNGKREVQQFSCKYDCWFCPNEEGQPRSYVVKEPGVLRANRNGWDPIAQVWNRTNSYIVNGHPIDKIELLILGGTWDSYPKDYREEFIRDCYHAVNNIFNPERHIKKDNRLSLAEEQKINRSAQCRIIGITTETRPDQINSRNLTFLRMLGVTRVQMGIQHTNDRVLKRINRQCTSKQGIEAIKLLKDCCFKVDIHIMPDLPQPFKEDFVVRKEDITPDVIDTTVDMVKEDNRMFDLMIDHPDWQADQWKIYPCATMPFTQLKIDYDNGSYKPYGDQSTRDQETPLVDVVIRAKSRVKPYVRINRIIRDIPDTYIEGGYCNVNMRNLIEKRMKDSKLACKCIRCREIGKFPKISPSSAVLKIRSYPASDGQEYFISYETPDEKVLFGFLRLRLSENAGKDTRFNKVIFPELENCAMLRELHIYGKVVNVGSKNDNNVTQHYGFGKKLVQKAIEIAYFNGYRKMSVIPGVGVMDYYQNKFGFKEENYFMTMLLPEKSIIKQPHMCYDVDTCIRITRLMSMCMVMGKFAQFLTT